MATGNGSPYVQMISGFARDRRTAHFTGFVHLAATMIWLH